nr:tetratricopeptide repeat protein [Dysgonomonas sp. 216]
MKNKFALVSILSVVLLFISCSNQKNTKTTRLYHEINTRYNIYFNAEVAYEEALQKKMDSYDENLSKIISVYPYYAPNEKGEYPKNSSFVTTIDKCTKAIKIHSIQVKPERNPGKRGNIAYQKWLEQREFNPFLKNAWLLMAKAEYQSVDYLKALTTFSYITRLYRQDIDVVVEARLWMAKSYTQMGWFYEAENVFKQIEMAGGVPDSQKKLYASVYTNYLIQSKKYEEAIPFLQQAIKYEGGEQSTRLKYLLGQVYAEQGNKEKAYEAFSKVSGLGVSFDYVFNARMQEARNLNIADLQQKKKTLSSLNRMTKQTKNKEYLDQVYYNIGYIHLQDGDTTNAIKNYRLAVEKSTRSGYDKAIAQVALGDLYFEKKDYVRAQPLYPEALGILGKTYERYDKLTLRSEVLNELVVYVEAVHLQDSLQVLAKMPEDERLAVVDKIIENLKKQREEERKQQELEKHNANRPSGGVLGAQQVTAPQTPLLGQTDASKFYFYNTQTVSQGKQSFRNQWGDRRLEDDWRRKNKTSAAFDDFFKQENQGEEVAEEGIPQPGVEERPEGAPVIDKSQQVTDLDREYYLRQIPKTNATLRQSNDIIEDALYQMGLIYKNRLEDLGLSVDAFDEAIKRFPKTRNLEEIYYQLFIIYMQLGNKDMAELYRSKILAEFAGRDYATMLSDPNYEWNIRNLKTLENSLYQQTYDAYMGGSVSAVRSNYSTAKEKYTLSELMPKFMFLNSLTFAQTGDVEEFKKSLRELIDKYPNADVTALASEMLKGVLEGRSLVGGLTGMVWNMQFGGGGITEGDSAVVFTDVPESKHLMMLIFDPKKVDRNQLLYDVADYNFSNFILQTFDLSFSDVGPLQMLQVKGFDSFKDIAEYTNKAFEDSSLVQQIDSSVIFVPISADNYDILQRGKSLTDYFSFVQEHYAAPLAKLISYWNLQMTKSEDEEAEVIEPENIPKTEVQIQPDRNAESEEKEPEIIHTEIPDNIKFTDQDEVKPVLQEKVDQGVETVVSDETVNQVGRGFDDAQDTFDEIADNPVDGIKGLIEKIKNKPKLTKEEKEAAKEEKKRLQQLEKERKAREKVVQDSIRAIEKAVQDSIKQEEREQIEFEKAAKKAKEDAIKDAAKAKEDARKARQEKLKTKEKARNEELKRKEKEREEKLKEREKQRKEKEKQRETELKERERQAREREKQRNRR